MSIFLTIATDHLPQGLTQGGADGTGFGLAQLGFGVVASTGTNAQYTKTTVCCQKATIGDLASGIYIWGQGNVNGGVGTFTLAANLLTNGTSDTSYIGMRCKPAASGPGQSGSYPLLLTVAGVGFKTADLGLVVGAAADYYLEFAIDRINNKITPFVDGKPLSPVAMVAGAYSGANAGLILGSSIGNNSYQSMQYHFSHMYFIDDTKDDTPCSRLGPSQLNACALASATGTDYTTSDGSALNAVLNSPLNSAAALTAPVINTPTSMGNLDMAFSANVDPYAQIKAVVFLLSAKKNPATDTAFKLSMKYNNQVVQGPMLSFADNNFKYSSSLGVQNKAPDGSSWTAAKLAATVVSLMPTNLTP